MEKSVDQRDIFGHSCVMAFILSENRTSAEQTAKAFQKYTNYLDSLRSCFPQSALKLATSDWWYSFGDSCPHDSWLESLEISEAFSDGRKGPRRSSIKIRLLNAYHTGILELFYLNVLSYKCELHIGRNVTFHGDWLYDEFTLAPNGKLVHEIEWENARWIIQADDITYNKVDIINH